jgi:AcrR family transcriptional regulator
VTATDRTTNHKTAEELMAATERLLVAGGHTALSTRRIAEEAGLPHGLVRYHFGTLEALVLRTLERAAERILDRQRALYAGDRPFIDKWRTAMDLLDADLEAGFPKLVGELFAKSWNDPAYRDGVRRMVADFTAMLEEGVDAAADDYGFDVDERQRRALVKLVRTFQIGMMVERLADIDLGHDELLETVDAWLSTQGERDVTEGERHAGPAA